MNDHQWQVLDGATGVIGSWVTVVDGRTARRLVEYHPERYTAARVRDVGPWRDLPKPDGSGS